MTEIIPDPSRHQIEHRPARFLPPADEYSRVVDLATRLSGTAFVPAGLRGDNGEPNPPAVLAAMLTGREVGLDPMESLRSIHMIEGRPTLSADAQMKLAIQSGHLLIVTETTRKSCTVKYRNAAWPDDEEARHITFDFEDAQLAGLTEGKRGAMYRKYPRAMLRSRAMTEAVRAGGLLSTAGIAYTAEELDDGDVSETIVVESIGPDDEDIDELDERRELHRRAADAYRRAGAVDPEQADAAWTAAASGLGENPWRDADLDVLRIRVADLERIADDLDDGDVPPADDDGGTPAPTSDGPTDDSDDVCTNCGAVDDHDTDDCTSPSVDEYEAELAPEALEDGYDDPTPDEPADDDHPSGMTKGEALETYYPHLTVADVGGLLRDGQVTIDVDGDDVTLYLPDGGLPLVERLEAEHHDPFRKTVRGALDSAAAQSHDGGPSDDGDGGAATGGSDDTGGPQTATESDPLDGLTMAELLDVAGDVVERLDQSDAKRFRSRLAELIADDEGGIPDRDHLTGMIRHARRLADDGDVGG